MPRSALLQQLLAPGGMKVAFQPMYRFEGLRPRIYALEALTRGPAGSNLERADVLFDYVRRKGCESEIDRTCVTNALTEFGTLSGTAAISLNVHAATLENDLDFTRFLVDTCRERQVSPTAVILEIVEQQPFCNLQRFLRNLATLREAGVRIALDDVGMGYSNFRMMVEIRPDFFKVDRYFVHGIHANAGLRAAVRSMVSLAADLGGFVVAEGVEAPEDLEVVLESGIELVQGYLLARPVDLATACASFLHPTPRPAAPAATSEQKRETGK